MEKQNRNKFAYGIDERTWKSVVLVLLLCITVHIWARETGFKYLRNYTFREYEAQPQNFCIVQGKDGIIYAANNGGLLAYDGVTWRLIKVENRHVRSLAVDEKGTVYVGGRTTFGKLEPGADGFMQYHSLSASLPEEYQDFSTVWNIHLTPEGVYFCTYSSVFLFSPGQKIQVWSTGGLTSFSFYHSGRLFMRKEAKGLVWFKNGSFQPVPGGDFFAQKKIYCMVPDFPSAGSFLVGTERHGLFIYMDGKTEPFHSEVNEYLREHRLFHGVRLSNGDMACATASGGMAILDAGGRLIYIFNLDNGLQDDCVQSISQDRQGNLWLGLNRGITRIEYQSPFFLYDVRKRLPGMVLSVLEHRGGIYAGSDRGLFRLLPGAMAFEPVRGISTYCWALVPDGDSLLAATSDGLFLVEPQETQLLIEERSYSLLQSKKTPWRVWVGMKKGLAALSKKEGNWQKEHIFKTWNQNPMSLAEDKNGTLWMGTTVGKVFALPTAESIGTAVPVQYDDAHGLPPKREIGVYRVGGKVIFATGNGVFRFDGASGRFLPDNALGEEYGAGGKMVFRLAESEKHDVWFHAISRYYRAQRREGKTVVTEPDVFKRIPSRTQSNTIYPAPGGRYLWLGTTDGLIKVDTAGLENIRTGFPLFIREVMVNRTEKLFGGFSGGSGAGTQPVLKFPVQVIGFTCGAPFYHDEASTRFRFFLEGYDAQWPEEWTPDASIEYTNLDPGGYVFRAQARNVYGLESKNTAFAFRILPPWYRTWWAYFLYILIFGLFTASLVRWRSHRLVREKFKLEKLVETRTTEVNLKNSQLEQTAIQLREQSEKLKEADHMKSRFFANISHEFRTPLTLILGPLERMLNDGGLRQDRDLQEMDVMLKNAQRLLRLINRLLDLSKLDSGRMRLRTHPQDLAAFLKGEAAEFLPLAKKKDLELELLMEREHLTVFFDQEKMEEIFRNLLGNAVKFTDPGGRITVSLYFGSKDGDSAEDGNDGYVNVSIKDTGRGIPRDKLPYIFDRFYQAHSSGSGKEVSRGTGIGLALAKELVNLHHGKINVHSQEGENSGTEFIIQLPLGSAHLEAGEKIENPSPGPVPGQFAANGSAGDYAGNHGTAGGAPVDEPVLTEAARRAQPIILVVEDNLEMRDFIRASLETEYAVVEAVDGAEGIEKAEALIPDLVVSDVMMPRVDGYQLCETIKGNVRTSHIPILLLTARASEDSTVEGLETGADDYITKPFSTRVLLARIKNQVHLRRLLQERIRHQIKMEPEDVEAPSMEETFLKELRKVVEKHLEDSEFNVDALSAKMYMGRTTLYRKVLALTGEPPNHFIRAYRLKRAAKLLEANYGNVTEVSFAVGFSSTAYFTKCFREYFHCLPTEYPAAE